MQEIHLNVKTNLEQKIKWRYRVVSTGVHCSALQVLLATLPGLLSVVSLALSLETKIIITRWRLCDDKLVFMLILKADSSDLI